RKPHILVPGASNGRFSRDGHWLAYSSSESGTRQVYVQSFPSMDIKRPISTAGGLMPMWGKDGEELFYLATDGYLMVVRIVTDGSTFDADPPQRLFQTGLMSLYPRLWSYGVSSDGQKILISVPEHQDTVPAVIVVSNWSAQLKH